MYRNSTIVLALTLLFVLVSYSQSQGQKKATPTTPVVLALSSATRAQKIGTVPAGTVPAQNQIVEIKLWNAAHDAKALGQAIDQGVQAGQVKTNKVVDAALDKLRADI